MPRRQKHLLYELAALPWWAGVAFAVVVYAAIRWFLPAIGQSNRFLHPLSGALADKAWWFAAPFLGAAVASLVASWYRKRLLEKQTGLETLRALSWQDFERLVGEAYRRQGYVIEEIGGSMPDGGIDLLLHRQGSKVVVQCKRWKSAQVGVSLIREFYGVTVAEKAERGIFVTTGTFTPDALEFAHGKPIELVDGTRLAALVAGLKPGKPVATVAATPSCPKCGGEMVQRVAKRGANAGRGFWGCRQYPSCSGVRNIA